MREGFSTVGRQEILVRAPGSFILVGGSVEVDAPPFGDGPVRLWADERCVCIGTLSEVDGHTRVVVGSNIDHSNLALAFSGEIATPARRLVISDAELNTLIEVAVPAYLTNLSIWTNDAREPSMIAINVTDR
ncbi:MULTISPECIES: hypothetical protein [unclassified Brevundimonas]|uniref:hypothetical protein n=1 Tax=unclassified Brevundimonas TaxID=2622653 RepID=UPI0011B06EB9|nr:MULTISPECIES: hypothetical protein [unclassified Brevundimonas]